MKLTFEQIKSIALGAVHVTEESEGIRFYRFTQEQFAAYEKRSEAFYKKSKSASGIKLSFRTDSRRLFMSFLVNE
jgi:hypothetical protein